MLGPGDVNSELVIKARSRGMRATGTGIGLGGARRGGVREAWMAVKGRPVGDLRQPPGVRREWLDEYVRRTASARGARRAREAHADLSLFIDYIEHTGRGDVSLLPWWEYSLALEWIS